MDRWEVGGQGGTGLCKTDPFVLGILFFYSCLILSWNPVLGALRILQPRKMEKSHLRYTELSFYGKLETTSICWDRLALGKAA